MYSIRYMLDVTRIVKLLQTLLRDEKYIPVSTLCPLILVSYVYGFNVPMIPESYHHHDWRLPTAKEMNVDRGYDNDVKHFLVQGALALHANRELLYISCPLTRTKCLNETRHFCYSWICTYHPDPAVVTETTVLRDKMAAVVKKDKDTGYWS